MRQFQKVLVELKDVVGRHRPGDALTLPSLLPVMEIKGRKVAYAAMGLDNDPENPPVVLLHGFGGFFMDWPRVMAPLARHTRVYAIDLPGWGFSEPNPKASSMEDDVEVVAEFMERLGLNKVILCGLSYGGGVAWAAAAMGLRRLSRAVLLNPMPTHPMQFMRSPIYKAIFLMSTQPMTLRLGHQLMRKSHYKMICRENLLNDRLLDTFYLDLAYMVMKQPKMPFILQAHSRGAKVLDWNTWEHRLAGTRIPVSILQGQQDRIFSLKSALHLHRLIPTSELIEIEECGHAMVFDQHRKVSEFILRHIQKKGSHEHPQEALREKRIG